MDVNEKLYTLSRGNIVEVIAKDSILGGVASSGALVVLCAGVSRSAAGDGPLVRPIAVNITANARVAAVGLTVLAPKAVISLGEYEAWFGS